MNMDSALFSFFLIVAFTFLVLYSLVFLFFTGISRDVYGKAILKKTFYSKYDKHRLIVRYKRTDTERHKIFVSETLFFIESKEGIEHVFSDGSKTEEIVKQKIAEYLMEKNVENEGSAKEEYEYSKTKKSLQHWEPGESEQEIEKTIR